MYSQDRITMDASAENSKVRNTMCVASESQLVIIDIQTKLGEVMPDKVIGRVIENSTLLLDAADRLGLPVLASQQYPAGLGPVMPQVREHLPNSTTHFEKTCFSCAGADGFMKQIDQHRRSQVIITGMEAHVCVLQTALELHRHGMEIFVVGDAVCSRRLDNYQNALDRLQRAGIIVTAAESVVFEWLRDARHEQFKAIAAMLR